VSSKVWEVHPSQKPIVFNGKNQEEDWLKMTEEGYAEVGYSSFNSGEVDMQLAISQAKEVHASAVVLYSKYTNTVSGATPLTLPNTQTSTTNMNGSTYGSGGYGSFNGNATTTTTGTQTTYIPYNIRRYDYGASYWIKLKPPVFGARFKDLDADTRARLESNKGVEVIAVIKKSPAFNADILRGDVLKKIGSDEIYDSASCVDLFKKYKGQLVDIDIIRNGRVITKQIQLNTDG